MVSRALLVIYRGRPIYHGKFPENLSLFIEQFRRRYMESNKNLVVLRHLAGPKDNLIIQKNANKGLKKGCGNRFKQNQSRLLN